MPRKRFTEEQIAFTLRQHEGGAQVAEIIRKLGISENSDSHYPSVHSYVG